MANGIWRNARFRDTQFPLAVYAVLSVLLLFLSRTQANLFDRVRATMTDWSAPALELVDAPVRGFNRWASNIDSLFSTYRDNMRLKEENARLRQWQGTAMRLQTKLAHEEHLLRAVPEHQKFLALAHVIGHSGKPFLQTLILDAGKANGAKPGQAVMDGRGLIGRIFVAGKHTSWVVLTNDINSRIPVVVGPGREEAILAGDNSDQAVLEALRPRAKVKDGDQVITSGDGGLIPAGIAVGVFVRQQGQARVSLFADGATADQVEIVSASTVQEQLPQIAPHDLPMAETGLTPLASPPPPAKSLTLDISPRRAANIVKPEPKKLTPNLQVSAQAAKQVAQPPAQMPPDASPE